MPNQQHVDLFQPLISARSGAPPIVLRVGIPNNDSISEGVPQGGLLRSEAYVMLSCLPDELRRRVELAIQALVAGR